MPEEQVTQQLSALFRLLADETRLSILRMLADSERSVGSLAQELKLTQPTVSHHLGLLRSHDVVAGRRAGKQVFYSLSGRAEFDSAGLTLRTPQFEVRILTRGE